MSDGSTIDLEGFGKNCAFKECNRLDFLPIRCTHCSLLFCKEHSSITSHICNKVKEPAADISVKPFQFYACSFDQCTDPNKEIVEVVCDYCKLNHCMKHRLPIDHNCVAKQKLDDETEKRALLAEEKRDAQKKEFKFEMKEKVNEKNAALAAKLTLMKLRQTAQGPPGLPELNKFYCFVQCNSSDAAAIFNDGKPIATNKWPIFFNLKWPVGKCVEFLVEKFNLNKSNLLKLKLFVNESLIDSSLILEKFIKDNSVDQGSTLELKLV